MNMDGDLVNGLVNGVVVLVKDGYKPGLSGLVVDLLASCHIFPLVTSWLKFSLSSILSVYLPTIA